ncbi:TetR/AcrR family transcriptional regulator [Agathobaculum sp. Marseille-P7918]|uniref:TetR/AcrR family transcriptional regulator n=1 Tax=Agathobaculum sp. Marseille-P7918 TaxID=2479843 RepID=UPI0035649838
MNTKQKSVAQATGTHVNRGNLSFSHEQISRKNMKELNISKRDFNNQQNREKLLNAMHQIIEKYDYNTVTIRNLCTVSGVSYGSFYNLFKTKENFLCFYLTHDFIKYMDEYYVTHSEEFQAMNPIEKSIDIFCCCAKYNIDKGLKFVSAFYSPNNYSLFPDPGSPEQEYSFTPLLRLGREYLTKAKAQNLLKSDADIERMIHMYAYIFNGVTFNWCISQAKFDIVGEVRKCLTTFLIPYTAATE